VSETLLREAAEKVNGALLRLVKNYGGEFKAIEQEAGTLRDGSLNLAGVELDGFHFMLMKVPAAELEPLTHRQREIAISVAAGLSNKEVSRRLEIKPTTVAAHLRAIYRKLSVDSRSGLLLRLFAAQDSSASRS
jgi:DNA-binding CsgD family transcriptional regulator